ncbi:MAG: hypothetical protein J0L64_20985 [Acidobacteria bacterium]|nr:hypothetical protein [Acidobacteriota bacterium]
MKGALPHLFAACLAAQAQQYFPFHVDQDALSGAPDFSHLNQPLEGKDRIAARNGHFFAIGPDLTPGTEDDTRVRFFGANLAFSGNFPEEQDAARIARRLRKLGINLVRLHHMDSSPDSTPDGARSVLLTTGPYPTFNPVALARLRVFLAALKAEGVYVNLNLHVGYTFRPGIDEIPIWPGATAFPTQSKPLHILHPRLVELQTRFTRELIQHLGLQDDPVLAMVETNNETSLLYSWQNGQLQANLLGDYRIDATRQWNEFLSAKYTETAKLREAWAGGASPDGGEQLSGQWRPLEVHSPSRARLEVQDGIATVTVEAGPAPVILKQAGFSVESGQPYLVSVEMRADLPDGVSGNVAWDVKQDVSPWRQTTSRTVGVTNQWQHYVMPFTASFDMSGIGRMGLSVERLTAPIHVRNASLFRIGRRGLADTESLEAANIALVFPGDGVTQARTDDFLAFVIARDRAYHQAMRAAIRESAGSLVPVAGTQMGFGGLLLMDAQRDLDYNDEHFYIDHPNFPNVAWDDRDWRIRDSSSVGSGLATFLNVATKRAAGQPYTVSEYNQAFPNSYRAEIVPTLSAFGAFQDWDSIMHFAYEHGRNWDTVVPSGFNLNVDHAQLPGAGQSALLFRGGVIEAGREPLDLPMPESRRLEATRERRNGNVSAFLAERYGYDSLTAFQRRVQFRTDLDGPLPEAATTHGEFPLVTDTEQLSYHPERRRFRIHSPQAAGIFGFLGTDLVEAGPITLQLLESARGFASTLLTSLDGEPIARSRRLLLSHSGQALRTQAGSTPARPQRLVNYPGTTDWFTLEQEPNSSRPAASRSSGATPIWMERIEATLTLKSDAQSITVWPLDGAGQRLTPLRVEGDQGAFVIRLQAEGQPLSPWFEIEAEQ